MFWKKKVGQTAEPSPASGTPPPAPPAKPEPDPEFDASIDTLAAMLRSFGDDAFDTDRVDSDEVRETCQDWASRILVGEARTQDTDQPDAHNHFMRDWGGVRRYFANHRSHEREYVGRSLGNLREAVQTFARCLSTTLIEDRTADERVGTQLGRLVGAFHGNDSTLIREEAEKVAAVLREVMDQRKKREKEQFSILSETIQALKDELRDARARAALDPLTQLYNRSSLDEHIDRVADLAFLMSSRPCVLMIDVDHFKAVNDSHGHATGDRVLKKVADTLVRQFLRKEDFVARYGGEEFVVVIPDSTLQNAEGRAERLRLAVEQLQVKSGDQTIKTSVSIGIATMMEGDSGTTWLERADSALYEAKSSGRNKVFVAATDGGRLSIRPGSLPPTSMRMGTPSRPALSIVPRALPENGQAHEK